MTPTFALALPHTPWIPARAESFARLVGDLGCQVVRRTWTSAALGMTKCQDAADQRIFAEKEPNWSWAQKMYRWACETKATHLVQLQDDVLAAPGFWPKLRAMVEAVPDQVISLQSPHPLGPEQFRTGRRWYRTRAWLLGVAWVWPLSPDLPNGLPAYLNWCAAHMDRVQKTNEDTLASQWLAESGFDVWHPCPTIVDHDVSVPSTYGNDGHHEFSMYRRSTVTWRDVLTPDAMNDVQYWKGPAEPPLLPGPGTQVCWFCATEQGQLVSPTTGARMGKQCLANMLGTMLGKL